MSTTEQTVVIKRHKSRHHDDHHGGSWKVAFADFALAMMALFLVLWVMQVANEAEKSEIANYARTARIVDSEELLNQQPVRSSLIELEGTMGIFDGHGDAVIQRELNGDDIIAPLAVSMRRNLRTNEEMLMVASELRDEIVDTDVSGNLIIEVQSHGVRLVLKDDEEQSMFEVGSSQMNPNYRRLLEGLAPILSRNSNDILISGHTDDRPFLGGLNARSNFDLSADRANEARKVLSNFGVPKEHILMVSGLADNIPVVGELPSSDDNRRIEIYLLNEEASQFMRSIYRSPSYQTREDLSRTTGEIAEATQDSSGADLTDVRTSLE